MERLLMLHLQSCGCSAEVLLNGMPLAYCGVAGGQACLAVHEYTLTGRNRIELIAAGPLPGQAAQTQSRACTTPTFARARLLLAHRGQAASDPNVRVLATLAWAAPEGKAYDAPVKQQQDVDLPVNFPRWRWLDAPPIAVNAGVHRQVLAFVQELALELARGNADPLIAAAKLRFDELALAYQLAAAEGVQRFRDELQRLYAAKALKIIPPAAEDLVLRPVLDGRLIECLASTGGPALRTRNDDASVGNQAWPLRLAMVEGRIYVLR